MLRRAVYDMEEFPNVLHAIRKPRLNNDSHFVLVLVEVHPVHEVVVRQPPTIPNDGSNPWTACILGWRRLRAPQRCRSLLTRGVDLLGTQLVLAEASSSVCGGPILENSDAGTTEAGFGYDICLLGPVPSLSPFPTMLHSPHWLSCCHVHGCSQRPRDMGANPRSGIGQQQQAHTCALAWAFPGAAIWDPGSQYSRSEAGDYQLNACWSFFCSLVPG